MTHEFIFHTGSDQHYNADNQPTFTIHLDDGSGLIVTGINLQWEIWFHAKCTFHNSSISAYTILFTMA